MSAPNDGGPAFPVPEVRTIHGELVKDAEPGLALRDYFAAKALQGLLSSEGACRDMTEQAEEQGVLFGRVVVSNAYRFADEMLLERKGDR